MDSFFQPFHTVHSGLVVVQTQTDLVDLRMILKVLEQSAGRCAAQGQIIAFVPVFSVQVYQRGKRERVNGAFRNCQPWTVCIRRGEAERKAFVASRYVPFETAPRSAQTGEPGAALCVFSDKDTVSVSPAFIENPGVPTRADNFRVNTTFAQVGNHGGKAYAGLWKYERF